MCSCIQRGFATPEKEKLNERSDFLMACKGAKNKQTAVSEATATPMTDVVEQTKEKVPLRILFGVDSKTQADDILQNNISEFEWVVRNKVYPNFWGRNITGKNALTRAEINFLHRKACRIAAIYEDELEKKSEEQGKQSAEKAAAKAMQLGIPLGKAIFLVIKEDVEVTHEYLLGFAQQLLAYGYTPGFKANTDAHFDFDREFSRSMQINKDLFNQCLVWAVAPTLSDYDKMTTTHLIHPDEWIPFAPSGITRDDIAIWQYGKECHSINDNNGNKTSFNINLIKKSQLLIGKMF